MFKKSILILLVLSISQLAPVVNAFESTLDSSFWGAPSLDNILDEPDVIEQNEKLKENVVRLISKNRSPRLLDLSSFLQKEIDKYKKYLKDYQQEMHGPQYENNLTDENDPDGGSNRYLTERNTPDKNLLPEKKSVKNSFTKPKTHELGKTNGEHEKQNNGSKEPTQKEGEPPKEVEENQENNQDTISLSMVLLPPLAPTFEEELYFVRDVRSFVKEGKEKIERSHKREWPFMIAINPNNKAGQKSFNEIMNVVGIMSEDSIKVVFFGSDNQKAYKLQPNHIKYLGLYANELYRRIKKVMAKEISMKGFRSGKDAFKDIKFASEDPINTATIPTLCFIMDNLVDAAREIIKKECNHDKEVDKITWEIYRSNQAHIYIIVLHPFPNYSMAGLTAHDICERLPAHSGKIKIGNSKLSSVRIPFKCLEVEYITKLQLVLQDFQRKLKASTVIKYKKIEYHPPNDN